MMATHTADLNNVLFTTAFLNSNLVLECPDIKLTEGKPNNPRVYCASGVIKVGVQTGAKACIVCKRDPTQPSNPMESIKRSMSVKSGQIFPDHYYFRLEATDRHGNVWTNPAVSLQIRHGEDSDEVRFECERIETEHTMTVDVPFAHLIFADKLDLPDNRIVTKFNDADGKDLKSIQREGSQGQLQNLNVLFKKVDGVTAQEGYELQATAFGSDPIPEFFENRLLEAIQFCTATLAWPVMSQVGQNGRRVLALSAHRSPNKGLVAAPLANRKAATDFYTLLGRYYSYACKYAQGDEWSPLGKRVGGLFTMQGVWLDSVALLLAVTAEGLLQQAPFKAMSKVAKPMRTLVKKIADAATSLSVIEELAKQYEELVKGTGARPLKDRMRALLQLMSSGRALDTMWLLQKAGAITKAEIQSWEKLRNSGAHGSLNVDETQLQEFIDHMHRVMTMIYKIVFLHIGYKGGYSNLGEHGWARAEFDGPGLRGVLGMD